ncbi:hypothetical protein Bca52824_019383 [Brassica carinata]|uniref:Uncharacterized protein n=1 Tax=Brassica carinata TaxID=52824 RepID=A0A8X7VRG1_BRACI|nr:hypothetical protein Bca52824_019383 [Brassica carinata]
MDGSGSEMDASMEDMKARKHTIEDEDDTSTTSRKRYFICKDFDNDGLHYRQPWVIGVQQEVERLKLKVLRHENLLRECEALKEQVKMLVKRVSELEVSL